MKEFLAENAVVMSIIIAAITAVGVFAGPRVASWQERRIREQNSKLRAHFEELRSQAETVISSASNLATMAYSWKLVVSEGSHGQIDYDFDELQVSTSFEAHFPEEAKELSGLKEEIYKHNAKCENFRQKLRKVFESKGLPVEQSEPGEYSMFIYEAALDALFTRWSELARCIEPWPDFQNINSNPVQGGHVLHPSGWGSSAVAFAKSEDEQEKCKLALAEIAEDMESQKEVAKMINSASKLVGEGKCFAGQLENQLDSIDRFWPGKKNDRFKVLKGTCSRCKEVF